MPFPANRAALWPVLDSSAGLRHELEHCRHNPRRRQVLTRANTLSIEPKGGWIANRNYRLRGDNCSASGIDVPFETTGTRPMPSSLGSLKLVDTSNDSIGVEHGASCSRSIFAAQARLRVDLSADAQPWADVIRYQTYVDGKPWTPREITGQLLAPGVRKGATYPIMSLNTLDFLAPPRLTADRCLPDSAARSERPRRRRGGRRSRISSGGGYSGVGGSHLRRAADSQTAMAISGWKELCILLSARPSNVHRLESKSRGVHDGSRPPRS